MLGDRLKVGTILTTVNDRQFDDIGLGSGDGYFIRAGNCLI